MLTREDIFKNADQQTIWQKYCGFLDLSLREFMDIQEGLLMEQIELVENSPLAQKIMNGKKPRSVEEFRRVVPLTTYWQDYAPYIGKEGQEASLASKPILWAHTSGRGGGFKWVPWMQRALERYADAAMAGLILACANRKGEVNVKERGRFLFILAPPPYISGISAWAVVDRFNLQVIPPPEISAKLEFQERIELGFKMALSSGVDFVGAVSTALVKVGETMAERSQGISLSLYMLRPSVLLRLARAWFYAKRERRPMLPKDLWPVKGLSCGGTDTIIYREKLKYYWGKLPHEIYGLTEAGMMAMQSWTKKDLTFYPFLAFFEFIPEEEWLRSREDKEYQPRTLLLDEVEAGKIYEIVITNFYGMPLLRYRPGDLVKITSLEDKEAGIRIPQMNFFSRADYLIDLYSIVRLDERTVWQAIDNTKIDYEDWSARKEYEGSLPILRIYIEPKGEIEKQKLEHLIHRNLQAINPLYTEAIEEMGTNPVKVTLLSKGSFQYYYEAKRKEGADLAHLKPPHMNATDVAIQALVQGNEEKV